VRRRQEGANDLELRRPPIYDQLADAIRAEILAGKYEPSDDDVTADELPGAAELGARFGVSDKTAARAIQRLIAEGLVRARPGLRPVVVPRSEQTQTWPMHRRYARAREAGGLVFGADFEGQEVVKEVLSTGWVQVPEAVAPLLRLDPEAQVWARSRRTLVDGKAVETSVSYFPAAIAQGTDLTAPGPFPPGGVVGVLERAGHRILRTYNEVRARVATPKELEVFGTDPDLEPVQGRIVIAITHATYGSNGEALEAVMSARPATDAVVVFQTYEGPDDARPHDPSITDQWP
jgi:GntR family transcriptional regulator